MTIFRTPIPLSITPKRLKASAISIGQLIVVPLGPKDEPN